MSEPYNKALSYLARREHCRFELRQKLSQKGFVADEIDAALDELEDQGYLSAERYVESMVRHRSNLGYGASRIRQQLLAMRLSDELISKYIVQYDWFALLREAWLKKFHGELPQDAAARRKQINFLQYRGFAMHNIQKLLNGLEE